MRMGKWKYLLLGVALALPWSTAFAQDEGHGHDYGHEKHEERDGDHDRDHYRYDDRREDIHGWYADHHDHLPPGLAKRDRLPPELERRLVLRETLPVELRGRIQACPPDLELRLPPPPPGYYHVLLGGHIVLLNRGNFMVADVFHFEL